MFTVSVKLPRENNKDYAYRVLKEAIMSLELQPGKLISLNELAEVLNTSRTPIREVMEKLRYDNLVEVVPQVGTFISKINKQLIDEAAFMRFTLEKEVLKLACESFAQEKLVALKRNIGKQELQLEYIGRALDFHRLDNEFHNILFSGNKKQDVWTSITNLSTHYNRIRLLYEQEHGFGHTIVQHKKIVTIIENKEVDQVEAAIRQHTVEPAKLWEEFYQLESPYADYFDSSFNQMVY